MSSYLHVYPEGKDEVSRAVQPALPGLKPVHMFAHYTGDDREAIRANFRRVHECSMFRMSF
jgi:hypothetical protein